jgi:hypothetical protein
VPGTQETIEIYRSSPQSLDLLGYYNQIGNDYLIWEVQGSDLNPETGCHD